MFNIFSFVQTPIPRYHISSCHRNIRNINNIIILWLWHYSTISSTCRTVSNVNNIKCEPLWTCAMDHHGSPWIILDSSALFASLCRIKNTSPGRRASASAGHTKWSSSKHAGPWPSSYWRWSVARREPTLPLQGGNPWGVKPLGTGAANGFPLRFGSLAMFHCIRGFRDGTNWGHSDAIIRIYGDDMWWLNPPRLAKGVIVAHANDNLAIIILQQEGAASALICLSHGLPIAWWLVSFQEERSQIMSDYIPIMSDYIQ